jgi:hypothetical protein
MLAILAAVSTETQPAGPGANQALAFADDGIPGKGKPAGPGPTDPGPVH